MENNIKSILTVTFEDPFWIAVYERTYFDSYEVCKITFGSEPKDYEVYDYMMNNWNNLCFTKPIKSDDTKTHHINPKRLQREINKRIRFSSIGTKAQQALNLQREQGKAQRLQQVRCRKEEQRERQFELRREKHKKKHRGR